MCLHVLFCFVAAAKFKDCHPLLACAASALASFCLAFHLAGGCLLWNVGGGLPNGLSAGGARFLDGRTGGALREHLAFLGRFRAADAGIQGRQYCGCVHMRCRLIHGHRCATHSCKCPNANVAPLSCTPGFCTLHTFLCQTLLCSCCQGSVFADSFSARQDPRTEPSQDSVFSKEDRERGRVSPG